MEALNTRRRRRVRVGLAGMALATLSATGDGIAAQGVAGRVLDRVDGRGLGGVRVTLVSEADERVAVTETDDGGAFGLSAPSGGRYRLEVDRLGYGRILSEPFEIPEGGTVAVELRVSPEAIRLEPLEVIVAGTRGRSVFERRRREWGKGIFITPEQVDSIAPVHPAYLFQGQDEMRVEWTSGLTDTGERRLIPRVRTPQGNGCFAYLIDGRPAEAPPWSTQTPWAVFPLSGLRPADIAAAEVYRSLAETPPELRAAGSRAVAARKRSGAGGGGGAGGVLPLTSSGFPDEEQCGVVVFWTRPGW